MVLKSYLIGPQTEGMQNNIKPFFLPEEAYFDLQDVYIWRDRVRKRFGYSLIGSNDLNSRLRINLGNTDGGGAIVVIVPGIVPVPSAVGQMFSLGTEIFTVNALGAPATLLATGAATVKTYNTTTGQVSITDAAFPATPLFFYPAYPVMGLLQREELTPNVETTIAFDTQFAYTFNGTAWSRLGAGADAVWTGTNSNFFWGCNYRGTAPSQTFFYTVNYVAADNIRYINQGINPWIRLVPQLNSGATRFLLTARIILPFKDRLLVFNTIETDGTFVNRCRYSQNGDPTTAATSWLDDVAGRGGFVDAPVSQQIITAQFIKDHLIVYFERSTWELIYTGNQSFPFRWQQINAELGCESSFSVIGFDTAVLGVGNVGVHNCNGVNVVRIDEKIPDEVYKIHNGNDGPARVYGIRDYVNELVYWTFPDDNPSTVFPTRILLYNYRNNTWAFFNDSFTCFGYFQPLLDLTWATVQFRYPTWEEWTSPWSSGFFQSSFPAIISGNQQGFVFLLDSDLPQNSQSLYITNMNSGTGVITVINHNLKSNDFILFEQVQGITGVNGTVFKVKRIDANTFTIDGAFSGTYTGAGKISRISNLSIQTKQFNPGTPIGQETKFAFIDFLLDQTVNGEVTLDYAIDTATNGVFQDYITPGIALGDTRLFTKIEDNEFNQLPQEQIWHRYFIQAQSEFIQLFFYMDDRQMKDLTISRAQFILHMYLIYVSPTGRLTG